MDDYGLTVEIRGEPGHVLITVVGEVDIATVPQLQERLAASAASGQPPIVDLDLVAFIHRPGWGCWRAPLAGPPRMGPACMRYAPGTRSGGYSPSPAWTARSHSPAL